MSDAAPDPDGEPNIQYRPLLFAIAYRMLGSVVDAEDAVQETFLRWQRARAAGTEVETPKAWLSAVVTRLCVDHLRSARAQRETYVGPCLPEPLVDRPEPDVAESVALAESVSLAFLVLLERLTPTERAVFLLHDVFGFGYGEVAAVVAKSPQTCRQVARRARTRIEAGRPRFRASPAQQARLTDGFVRACAEGDLSALMATLADDVTLWSDGGAKARAARRPLHGAEQVARFLLGIVRNAPPGLVRRVARVNGQPGIVLSLAGRPFGVVALEIAEDRIQAVRIVVNPDKLGAVPVQGG